MLFGSTLLHLPHKPNPISIKKVVIFSLKTQTMYPKLFLIISLPIKWAIKVVVVVKTSVLTLS